MDSLPARCPGWRGRGTPLADAHRADAIVMVAGTVGSVKDGTGRTWMAIFTVDLSLNAMRRDKLRYSWAG